MFRPSTLLLILAVTLPAAARAATSDTSLSVSAVVLDACRFTDGPRQLHVACPGRTPYSVSVEGSDGGHRLAGTEGTATYDLRDATTVTLTY